MTVIPYFIAQGIPKRLGATRCVLGTLRSSPETTEADENTTEYDNVTGCSPRNPEHGVKGTIYEGETEEENYAMVTAMTPYSSYPTRLPSSSDDDGTHIIIKARGELERDLESGEWLFPKLKLTIRPLFSRLNYKWVSDAVGISNLDSVTSFGGNYEEDINGESIWYDFDFLHEPNYPYWGDDPITGTGVNRNAFVEDLLGQYYERGRQLRLEGDFYYKAADRPPNLSTDYSPPLRPWEIDLTLYPRADGEEAYEFKKNESWDLRYRSPTWYPQYGGTPLRFTTDGYHIEYRWSTPNSGLASENPFSKPYRFNLSPEYSRGLPQRLVPVEKYVRVQEGSPAAFPIEIPYPEGLYEDENGNILVEPYQIGVPWISPFPESYRLHKDRHIQIATRVRKRYPFSFDANTQDGGATRFFCHDNNPANFYAPILPFQDPPYTYFTLTVSGFQEYFATRRDLGLTESVRFNCESWWRMEIDTERCEWNFNEALDEGWTIKGYIEFGKKLLEQPYHNDGTAVIGTGVNDYTTNPSKRTDSKDGGTYTTPLTAGYQIGGTDYKTINQTSGVYPLPAFGFSNPNPEEVDDAGVAPFAVKVTKDNALGKPVAVLDFPIGGQTFVPDGSGGYDPVQWGDAPERSIVFIKDFYITEIIPPEPPEG